MNKSSENKVFEVFTDSYGHPLYPGDLILGTSTGMVMPPVRGIYIGEDRFFSPLGVDNLEDRWCYKITPAEEEEKELRRALLHEYSVQVYRDKHIFEINTRFRKGCVGWKNGILLLSMGEYNFMNESVNLYIELRLRNLWVLPDLRLQFDFAPEWLINLKSIIDKEIKSVADIKLREVFSVSRAIPAEIDLQEFMRFFYEEIYKGISTKDGSMYCSAFSYGLDIRILRDSAEIDELCAEDWFQVINVGNTQEYLNDMMCE